MLLFKSGFASAQGDDRYLINAAVTTGQILKHSERISELAKSNTNTFILDYGIRTNQWFAWGEEYGNPYIGLTFFYNPFSDPSLDFASGLIVFFENKLHLWKSPLFFNYHLGSGIVYVNNIFDEETNSENEAISTYLNHGLNARIGFGYEFSSQWSIKVESSLLHFSNTSVYKPNYGINIINHCAGLSYRFGDSRNAVTKEVAPRASDEFIILYNAGTRQVAYQDPYVFVHNLNLEYNRQIAYILNIGLGWAIMDAGISYEFKKFRSPVQIQNNESLSRIKAISSGPYINLEFFFNRLSVITQGGFYLFHPHRDIVRDPETSVAYNNFINNQNEYYVFGRIGLRYRFPGHFFINLSGNTQVFKMQHLELGIGTYF